jgi:hypothetical protein
MIEEARFIVVVGETIGLLVVSYRRGASVVPISLGFEDITGAGYKIWRGLEEDEEEFDEKPSVFKIHAALVADSDYTPSINKPRSAEAKGTDLAPGNSPELLLQALQSD